jgi:hypothetical protein
MLSLLRRRNRRRRSDDKDMNEEQRDCGNHDDDYELGVKIN